MKRSRNEACSEADLQSYVEGVLDLERRHAVERYLAANPEEARRIAAYRTQNVRLAELLSRIPEMERPEASTKLARALSRKLQRHRQIRTSVYAAGVAGLVFASVTAGWWSRGQFDERAATFATVIAQQAAQGYRLYAGSDGFAARVAKSGEIDPFGWLAQRSQGHGSVAPDLTEVGFHLSGGWIFPTQYGSAVQLLYLDKNGEDVTLYVARGGPPLPEAFSYAQNDDVSLLFWQSGSVGYCLAGRFERPQLVGIAKAIVAQLSAANSSSALGSKALPRAAPSLSLPKPAGDEAATGADGRGPAENRAPPRSGDVIKPNTEMGPAGTAPKTTGKSLSQKS